MMFAVPARRRNLAAVLVAIASVGAAILPAAILARPLLAAAPPEPTPQRGVLDLPGEGFAAGQFGPAPAAGAGRTFTWQSPAFAAPFEFPWNGIVRIRLAPAPAPAMPPGAWRADLRGNGVVIGTLEAIDAEHVTLAVPGVGAAPLRLRRDAIIRLAREGGSTRVHVPGTLAGWDADRKAWREEAGRLAGSGTGVTLSRDLAAPPRACFELALSWDERPEFEIALAAGPQAIADLKGGVIKKTAADSYRVETGPDGEVLVVRESQRVAKLGVAGTIPAGPGRLWLRVFVDQGTGRLAVTPGDAVEKPVADLSIPPAQSSPGAGLGLRLRRGSLRIERLRIHPWTEQDPRLAEPAGLGGPQAVLESFDKAAGAFVIGEGGERREVPVKDAAEIGFGPEQPPTWPEGAVMAVFHGGTLLAGRVLDITPPMIRLDVVGLAEPLQCELRQIAMLENVIVPAAGQTASRSGMLEGDGIRMPGCLATTNAAAIGWQPRGGLAVNPLGHAKLPLRIVYRPEAATAARTPGAAAAKPSPAPIRHQQNEPGRGSPSPPPKPFPDGKSLLFLKTGDAILCKLLGADDKGVRIRNDAGVEVLVPAAATRAVELVAAPSQLVSKTKTDRLLMLPRVQQADPPTHLLRLSGGDFVRGKLVAVDDKVVKFDVAGVAKELPRADVTRLIWLSVQGDGSEAAAIAAIAADRKPDDVLVRALVQGPEGPRRMTCVAERLAGERLVGRNAVLGEVAVNLADCVSLDIGPAAATLPDDLPYAQWRLKPAAVPRALQAGK